MGLFILFIHLIKNFDGFFCFYAAIRCEEDASRDKCVAVSFFFGHVTVSCNDKRNITMKESPLGSLVMRGKKEVAREI